MKIVGIWLNAEGKGTIKFEVYFILAMIYYFL